MVFNFLLIASITGAFFIGMFTYRLGLKDGLAVKKDQPITKIQPIQKVQQTISDVKHTKAEKEAEKKFQEELNIITEYDGTLKASDQ